MTSEIDFVDLSYKSQEEMEQVSPSPTVLRLSVHDSNSDDVIEDEETPGEVRDGTF
ncbi:1387_t:CDS:2 [Funneliformis mosseae]|uniref:1387_t:CDS:1 n=1 Tax=Funneliformis mosseae TaxID=27381 RepID=A0A9N9G568_FUNMO|nr:1387_t:CDS:2 [Funneliformis mosseae]